MSLLAGRGRFSLRVVDLRVAKGESVLLLGESGSGKSTLLSLICGTIVPDSGRIEIAGQDITELSASKRDKFRAEQIGVIFQQFNLLPFGTVADNIMLPLRFAPARNKQAGDALAKATELCRALGLPDGVTNIKATCAQRWPTTTCRRCACAHWPAAANNRGRTNLCA